MAHPSECFNQQHGYATNTWQDLLAPNELRDPSPSESYIYTLEQFLTIPPWIQKRTMLASRLWSLSGRVLVLLQSVNTRPVLSNPLICLRVASRPHSR
jgi:protoporphyrinogen oxidase